jgi:hypothetical protein
MIYVLSITNNPVIYNNMIYFECMEPEKITPFTGAFFPMIRKPWEK